jgi:hypothetical protein
MKWRVFLLLLGLVVPCCGKSSPVAPTPPHVRLIGLEGAMDFGEVLINTTSDRYLTIHNYGPDWLNITGITVPNGYTATSVNGTVYPDHAVTTKVSFAPTAQQSYNGILTVNCDYTAGTNTIPISGKGQRELFRAEGSGDKVLDTPLDLDHLEIDWSTMNRCTNLTISIDTRVLLNIPVGYCGSNYWSRVVPSGGGGVLSVKTASDVSWQLFEVRYPVPSSMNLLNIK